MALKETVKKALTVYNPLAIHRRNTMRKALTNPTASLLVPNCLGGTLFHDLGLQFRSPWVNLMMYQKEFVKVVHNLDEYLAKPLVFFNHPEYTFPCAKLGDVTVHFTHYNSEEEAQQKWKDRCERLDRDNLFIIAVERDGLTKEEILSLNAIKARGIVVFTAHDYPDIPHACYVPKLVNNGVVEGLLERSWVDDHRKYEEFFDFVKWFNQANGGDYDVSKFVKGKA